MLFNSKLKFKELEMSKIVKIGIILAVILFCIGCSKKQENKIEKYDEMVLVNGGTFQMGSNEAEAEGPEHSVTVSDFYIGKYEVTLQRWYDYLKYLQKKDVEKSKKYLGENFVFDNEGNIKMVFTQTADKENCPIYSATWIGAAEFCNWLSEQEGLELCYRINDEKAECNFSAKGYRLPTEAEWEYAARGGNQSKGFKFSGSDIADEVAEYEGNNNKSTKPVGGKKTNELGIFDMSGNVWEWCWDLFDSYSVSVQTNNPQGPAEGSAFKVLRGGSWYNLSDMVRCTFRSSGGGGGFGFRVARTK